MKSKFLYFIFLFSFLVANLYTQHAFATSIFGPHTPPPKGPWFEGWYVRLTDIKEHRSVAVITTTQLNPDEAFKTGKGSSGYLAILVQNGEGQPTQSFESFPQKTFIRTQGKDLSLKAAINNADFTWEAPQYGWLSPEGFDLRIPGQVEVKARLSEGKPWSRYFKNWGPEGFGSFMPLIPLHWFVQSLSSHADYYLKMRDAKGTTTEINSQASAHIEKNWGKTFPKSWVWLQADDVGHGKSLALAGGVLKMGPLNIKTYLAGYKSKKIDAEFQIGQLLDLTYTDKIDPCSGTYEVEMQNGEYRMIIKAHADPKSFSTVSIPTLKGYQKKGAQESFSTEISVEVHNNNWVRDLISPSSLLERTVFKKGALEFGGEAMKCTQKKYSSF